MAKTQGKKPEELKEEKPVIVESVVKVESVATEVPKPKHAGGRPTDYRPEYCEQVYRLCLLGLKDTELAEFFEVSDSTLNLWKLEHSEFSEALKRGKEEADQEVVVKLRERALGYSHPEDKIFLGPGGEPVIVPTIKHYPPDPTSLIFWLKNRHPGRWRDKKEIAGSIGITVLEPGSIQKPVNSGIGMALLSGNERDEEDL